MSYAFIAMQNIVLAPGETAQLWNQMLIMAVNDKTDQFDKWEQDAKILNEYLYVSGTSRLAVVGCMMYTCNTKCDRDGSMKA